ncbi:50S ribosomal protein 5, chloroplastic [Dendrobium catenatum]|uniref:50S ribosomal protein 5, chloroplastic n=1 Tax=Dendrobium catenatum TaxID=906689 RepID=A0A2I0WT86_9ASPA|nr:50S ribosomal protein 5, chloroplastic [Dendrobium catenatum]PKU78853.1 50S ribosomal protein 5, chloroplastic [Dendrobium catenatum]
MSLRTLSIYQFLKKEESEAAAATMAVSLAPISSLFVLTQANTTTGIRSPPILPMAPSFFEMKLWRKYSTLQKVSSRGIRVPGFYGVPKRTFIVVHASLETNASGSELPPLEGSDKPVSVESLPLESKKQMLLEQKLRMKLAKKIRLRRKRLVRKRRMRKKGRWPPSKMKKNKNV